MRRMHSMHRSLLDRQGSVQFDQCRTVSNGYRILDRSSILRAILNRDRVTVLAKEFLLLESRANSSVAKPFLMPFRPFAQRENSRPPEIELLLLLEASRWSTIFKLLYFHCIASLNDQKSIRFVLSFVQRVYCYRIRIFKTVGICR